MVLRVLDGVLDDDARDRDRVVDISTAATRLGLSVDGVRKRIQRRQLASVKRDGRVYVVLDAVLDTPPVTEPLPDSPPPSAPDGSSTVSSTASSLSTESLTAQLARADAEITFLRSQLEARDAELERKDAILMRLVEQRAPPQLAVAAARIPLVEPAGAPAARPWWWRIWRW